MINNDKDWDGSPSKPRKPTEVEQLRLDVRKLTKKIKDLEKQISDEGWRTNPDRMGGCYTEDEKNADTWK